MKASLSNHRQSPRKTRLVADIIRGKNVIAAKEALHFLPKKSAPHMMKLLDSAIANARSMGQNPENLIVKKVAVDKALVIRRFTPKARGRAGAIRKTRSHITIVLGTQEQSKSKSRNQKAE
jgi:large subunit ribosomal protein L22